MNRLGVKSLLSLVFVFELVGSSRIEAESAQNFVQKHGLLQGDLIFTDLNCELCEAIEAVTQEQFGEGPALSHAGILDLTDVRDPRVIEALPVVGVVSTPLLTFLARSPGGFEQPNGYFLGLFRPEYREAARRAVIVSRGLIGLPYDEHFDWNDPTSYYCTKMLTRGFIQDSFPLWIREWPHPFSDLALMFRPQPMFFGKPGTPARTAWEDYFRKRNKPTPDGQLGISPLGMYLQGRAQFFVRNADLRTRP